MKNLKKLVSVIVTVAMLISSFAALSVSAAYPDVDESNSYAKAIEVLSGLGIVKGDDEGNFNPTAQIKRSEMVALICRMKGEDAIATSTVQEFDDVPSNHWAAGYISWGVGSEIIKGYGDGNFGPDAPVTLQDAVVMIVRAAGWERIANRSDYGGYPTGHLRIANLRGVMDNINYTVTNAATRDVVAQAVYNGMTLPLVEYTSYGEKVEDDAYGVYDGTRSGYALRHLLSTINKIYKVRVTVDATAKATEALRTEAGDKVQLTTAGNYNYDYTSYPSTLGVPGTIKPYVGETNVADYLGYTVEAYVAYDNDLRDYKLLAAVPDDNTVSETIAAADVYSFDSYDATKGIFKYWVDANDTRAKEVEVKATRVFYNGSLLSDVSVIAKDAGGYCASYNDLLTDAADEITFMGKKNEPYNTIFVTDYDYVQAKEVIADDELISIKKPSSGAIDLSKSYRKNNFVYNVYNAEGEEIELSEIKENDILNIVVPLDTKGQQHTAFDNVAYMDIYVTNEVVTGAVEEQIVANKLYKIAGEKYKTIKSGLKAGYEGTYFLTIDGRVFEYDASSSISKNFAFILGAGADGVSGLGKEHKVKLFTADGKIGTYKLTSKTVRFYDGSNTAVEYKTEAQKDTLVGALAATVVESALVTDEATTKATIGATIKNRVITYKLNSEGEITEIRRAAASTGNTLSYNDYADRNYKADTNVFALKDVVDSSVLFVAPITLIEGASTPNSTADDKYGIDEDDLEVASFTTMNDDETYPATYFVFDDTDDEIALAVVGKEIKSQLKFSHLAVVKSKGTVLDADENEVNSYTIVQGQEVLTVVEDYDAGLASLSVGDIFRYSVNEAGEMNKIETLSTMLSTYTYASLDSNDIAIVQGQITELEDGKMTVAGVDKLRLNDTEGNTYATIDRTSNANTTNFVNVMRGTLGLRATYAGSKTVYSVVAIISEDGRYEDCIMTISDVPVTSVALSDSAKTIAVGGTYTLVATVAPSNASEQEVVWSIVAGGDADITVNGGVVTVADTATTGDTATVKVTTVDGGYTDTCVITVA